MMAKKIKAIEKRPVGRPRKVLDTEMIFRLAWIQCTNEEIALVMNCNMDTLADNFSEILKRGRAAGKASLRRAQWRGAQKGNATMLIWLGKQTLGQRDRLPDDVGDKTMDEMLIELQRKHGFTDPPEADGKKPN